MGYNPAAQDYSITTGEAPWTPFQWGQNGQPEQPPQQKGSGIPPVIGYAPGAGGSTIGAVVTNPGAFYSGATGAVGPMATPGAEAAFEAGGSLAAAAPYLGAAGAAYGGYNLWDQLSSNKKDPLAGAENGAIAGAGVGTMILPGPGTAIGAGIGALGGGIAGMFGGSTDPSKLERRSFRTDLGKNSNLGEQLEIQLHNGGTASLLHSDHNVNFHQTPFVGDTVALADPIAYGLTHRLGYSDPHRQTDASGMLTNLALTGATSKDDARQNLLRFVGGLGWNISDFRNAIQEGYQSGNLDANKYKIFMKNLDSLAAKKG